MVKSKYFLHTYVLLHMLKTEKVWSYTRAEREMTSNTFSNLTPFPGCVANDISLCGLSGIVMSNEIEISQNGLMCFEDPLLST